MDFPTRGYELRDGTMRPGAQRPQRIHLDMGEREKLAFCGAQELADHLEKLRLAVAEAGHADVWVRMIRGVRHDEWAWGHRFPEAYRWAFFGEAPGSRSL